MERAEFAQHLIVAEAAERRRLLREHAPAIDVGLARVLNSIYQAARVGDPLRAARAAECLALIEQVVPEPEVGALAAWTSGMAAIHLDGQMERGVTLLTEATLRFNRIGQPLDAAATQVSNLQGLPMLGWYDEAISAGVAARDVFAAHHDLVAAGKIDQNLGNIAYRRGRFQEAEGLYRSAHECFRGSPNQKDLAQIDNCLGTVLMEELRFAEASTAFEDALARAQRAGLEVTETEIQHNLGILGTYHSLRPRARPPRARAAGLRRPGHAPPGEPG